MYALGAITDIYGEYEAVRLSFPILSIMEAFIIRDNEN